MKKLLTFFSKNISIYAIFNDQSFNDTLTNDLVLNNWALMFYNYTKDTTSEFTLISLYAGLSQLQIRHFFQPKIIDIFFIFSQKLMF